MSGLWVGLGALAKLQLFCKLGFCALALCGLQMCCNVQWVVDVFVRQLIFARSLVGVADNGKGLCEVRATATESGEENQTLAKTFSIF